MVKKGGKVLIGIAAASAAGVGLYLLVRKKPEEPVCQEGQKQTKTCPDGSVITTHTCVNGKWQSTGATCPPQPPEEINAEITDIRVTPGAYNPGDTITIGVDFKNTGNVSHTFKIGVSIGKDGTIWYDIGYYNDGHGDYRQATLVPGASIIVTRSLRVPDDGRITDIWVTVRDKDLNVLDTKKKIGIISVTTAVSAQISNVVLNGGGLVNKSRGDRVSVKFDLKNTGSSPTVFDMALAFDTANAFHYIRWFNGVDTIVINPGQTIRYTLWFTIPGDAPLNHYFSINVFVYPLGKFDKNNPGSNYLDVQPVHNGIYVS